VREEPRGAEVDAAAVAAARRAREHHRRGAAGAGRIAVRSRRRGGGQPGGGRHRGGGEGEGAAVSQISPRITISDWELNRQGGRGLSRSRVFALPPWNGRPVPRYGLSDHEIRSDPSPPAPRFAHRSESNTHVLMGSYVASSSVIQGPAAPKPMCCSVRLSPRRHAFPALP
jgi:hypothetical protein